MARRLEVAIIGDATSFKRSLGQSSSAASKFGQTAKRVGKAVAVGLGAGLAVAVVGLKKSFDAAKESQLAQQRMVAQLKASGVAYGKFAGKIDDVITKQSRLSALDDEDLTDSFTNLVRVTEDVNEALRLNALAADFARAKGIDVAKAGELIGKVAGGNIGILSRYGIQLEDGATKQEALATLQEKFAGQAEAYGSSVAGAGDRVGVAMENIAETVGEMVFPLADKVLTAFSGALEQVQDFVNEVAAARGFKAKFNVVFTGVKEQAARVWNSLSDFLTGTSERQPIKLASGKIIEWEDPAPGLIDRIRDGIEAADWSDIGQRVGAAISERIRITADFITNVLETAGQVIDQNSDKFADLGAKMLLKIISKLLDPAFWKDNWKLILGIAVAVFPIGRITSLGVKVAGFFLRPLARLLPEGFRLIGGRSVDAILEVLGKLPGRVQAIILRVIDEAGKIVKWLKGKLKPALDLVPGWIKAAFKLAALVAFIGKVQDVIDKIRELIDWIKSIPSPGEIIGGVNRAVAGGGSGSGAPVGRGARPPRGASVESTSGGLGGGRVQVIVVGGDQQAISYLQQLDQRSRRNTGGRGILS